MKFLHLHLALLLGASGAFAACGTSVQSGPGVIGGGASSSGGSGGSGGDDASTLPSGSDGGSTIILTGPDGSVAQGTLAITPLAPVLTAITGAPPPTQQFSATVGGQPAGVAWAFDQGALGAIDKAGKFTATGTVGGVGRITATNGAQTVSTTITINVQTTDNGDPGWSATPGDAGAGGYGGVGGDGPGPTPGPGQTGTLNGTPAPDPNVAILYPYDGTVWPQGLLAPLLQWNPGGHAFDSVYVHIKENNYEYKGYFGANTTGPFVNLPIPAAAWSAMAFSNGGEKVQISLTFAQGTNAYGPYTETWTIAQATLQGTIYYNSYGTALVKNSDSADSYGAQYGAGTLAITPGATAPSLVAGINGPEGGGGAGGCRVCHTVAANGQSLLTQASSANAGDYTQTVRIDLANDATGGAGTAVATPNLTYPALYKDGSLLFSGAGGMINSGGSTGSSQLIALPAGTPVAGVTGLPAGLKAALPAFSPDGAHVSFDFWDGSFVGDGGAALTGDQRSLAILDFNGTNAFSNPRVLFTPPAGTSVTYSSFFPNAAGVVFEVELTNPSGNWGYTWGGNTGELWWLDVASGKAHRLDALNGYGPSGTVALPAPGRLADGGVSPHTPALDATLNYEPTVNPIASGGYAWVVFTSRRMYGNVAQLDPWTSDPRHYPWLAQVTDKKLWVAAVDLNGTGGTDPSHPPFYLPAQEIHAGNARGYWTVEPCRADGQSCQTGDQCCGGFCETGSDGGLQCTVQAPSCSGQYDKCTTTSDCCGASTGIQCINGICSLSSPK